MIATIERFVSYCGDAVGDGDGGQACAVLERTIPDGVYAIFYGDGGKTKTFIESSRTNGGHAVGDGDGGQATTPCERTRYDVVDRIWNDKVCNFRIFITI